MSTRSNGTEFHAARVRERLVELLGGGLSDGLLERLVRDVVLVEFRRGFRAGMLEAAFSVTEARERFAIRQAARGWEPEDLEDELRIQGRRVTRFGAPDDPFEG